MLVCLLPKNVCFRSVNRFKLWGMETSRRAKGLDLSLQYGARSRNVGLTILFISELISLYRLLIFFQSKYREFLLSAELVPEEEYDSDVDPTFIPPPIFELDFDYDEYSDGEIQVNFNFISATNKMLNFFLFVFTKSLVFRI
jgi:hypothetical protein